MNRTPFLVTFQPVGPLSFRNGLPFDAGVDHFSAGIGMPPPTTATGAIARALGENPRYVRGPVLADLAAQPSRLRFPVPLDLVRSPQGPGGRLSWDPPQQALSVDGVHVAVPTGLGETPSALTLSAAQLESYLRGFAPLTPLQQSVQLGTAMRAERHVGLAKGREGLLYTSDLARMGQDLGFACVVEAKGATLHRRVVPLGGEGGMVEVRVVHSVPDGSLPALPEIASRQVLLYLATPAVFDRGWWPNLPPGARLVGACVQGPVPVASGRPPQQDSTSGWRLRWAVAEGSVYVVELATPALARAFASLVHGRCLGTSPKALQTAGFGWCFAGLSPMGS